METEIDPVSNRIQQESVADPGFSVGGRGPVSGGVDLRCGCFSLKMCVKTKELGPLFTKNACENERIGSCRGGMRWARPLNPPMSDIYKGYLHLYRITLENPQLLVSLE